MLALPCSVFAYMVVQLIKRQDFGDRAAIRHQFENGRSCCVPQTRKFL
jgi:hypothetical protein